MKKIGRLTLTPNRSNPRRFVKLVIYRVEDGRVVPRLWKEDDAGRATVEPIRFRDIAPSAPDPDFAAAWLEHVRANAPASCPST